MAGNPKKPDTGELLAGWRSATEVEAAARAASEAVERARAAATKARAAAAQAAQAARISLSSAEGDKVRAQLDVEVAEQAEADARDRYHVAENEARGERVSS